LRGWAENKSFRQHCARIGFSAIRARITQAFNNFRMSELTLSLPIHPYRAVSSAAFLKASNISKFPHFHFGLVNSIRNYSKVHTCLNEAKHNY
jgi:hypothetical protein